MSSFRAKLRALLEVLRMAVPPLRIHTDNKSVVDGVKAGRRWCTRAKAKGADLWRLVFDRLEELEEQGEVAVLKVKAHTSWFDVLSGKITPREQFGNWLADSAAKKATAASEAEAPTIPFNAQLKKALAWIRWAACYSTNWVQDITPQFRPVPIAPPGNTWEFGDMDLRHERWLIGGRALCRRCGIALPTQQGDVRVSLQRAGAATGIAAAHATGNINFAWARFVHSRRQLLERG